MHIYYGFSFLYFVLHIIWWVIIVALIIWLIRLATHGGPRYHAGPRSWMRENGDAMRILRERYAKGEITKEEFEERKKTLME